MQKNILIIVIFLSALILSITALNMAFKLPETKPYSPVIYDRNGTLLNVFRTSDGMWRIIHIPMRFFLV